MSHWNMQLGRRQRTRQCRIRVSIDQQGIRTLCQQYFLSSKGLQLIAATKRELLERLL